MVDYIGRIIRSIGRPVAVGLIAVGLSGCPSQTTVSPEQHTVRESHTSVLKQLQSQYGEGTRNAYESDVGRGTKYSLPAEMKGRNAVFIFKNDSICGRVYLDRQSKPTNVEFEKWCLASYRAGAAVKKAKEAVKGAAEKARGIGKDKKNDPLSRR